MASCYVLLPQPALNVLLGRQSEQTVLFVVSDLQMKLPHLHTHSPKHFFLLRLLLVETNPAPHSRRVLLLKLLSVELETKSYYLVNRNVRGYLSWELRLFFPVHCTTLVTTFPQQSSNLPLVGLLFFSLFCTFLVSLPAQASLPSPARLSPRCSQGRTLRPTLLSLPRRVAALLLSAAGCVRA